MLVQKYLFSENFRLFAPWSVLDVNDHLYQELAVGKNRSQKLTLELSI